MYIYWNIACPLDDELKTLFITSILKLYSIEFIYIYIKESDHILRDRELFFYIKKKQT